MVNLPDERVIISSICTLDPMAPVRQNAYDKN